MTKYYCVNFDHDVCLAHGIEKQLWLMQYQFADAHGNLYQANEQQKRRIKPNWDSLRNIQAGDWFAAYRSPNTFYAIGRVIEPRRPRKPGEDDTIDNYLKQKKSHEYHKGYRYYTPASYEDYTDEWRYPDDRHQRYPQRIDVDRWQYKVVPRGVTLKVLGNLKRPNGKKLVPNTAVFEIPENVFNTIKERLQKERAPSTLLTENEVGDGVDDSVVELLEENQAASQGYLVDGKLRKALEDYAMSAAKRYFTSLGYVVEDHSKTCSYDLHCTRGTTILFVEVKGTQTSGESVFLTPGEVRFAREHKAQMALFLLHSINVSADTKVLTNGKEYLVEPWDVDQGYLKPMSYKYELPSAEP